MYRAAARMMPIVLNYLPPCLEKLCLENFHLVVVGMPGRSDRTTQQQLNSTSSLWHRAQRQQQQPPGRQQQDQDDTSSTGTAQHRSEGEQQAAETAMPDSCSKPAAQAAAAADSSTMDAAAVYDQPPAGADDTENGKARGGSSTSSSDGSRGAGTCSTSSSKSSSSRLFRLPLQHLRHVELEECCVDDTAITALLGAATGLRTLELAGETAEQPVVPSRPASSPLSTAGIVVSHQCGCFLMRAHSYGTAVPGSSSFARYVPWCGLCWVPASRSTRTL